MIRAANTLAGSLKKPNLESDVRPFIQTNYDIIQEYIGIIEELFETYGGIL